MRTYSGAGVIPIIIHEDKPYFVLFMLNRGVLTDAGGSIEKKSSPLDTASRELFEESAGLFNIDSSILDNNSVYIDINTNSTDYYRSYITVLNNFRKQDMIYYYNNLDKIKNYNYNPFSETRGIYLISFDYIHLIDNHIYMNTDTNQVIVLSTRTGRIIKKIYDKFKDLYVFYDKITKKIKKISVKKENNDAKTYTYGTHKTIDIKNLDTFMS